MRRAARLPADETCAPERVAAESERRSHFEQALQQRANPHLTDREIEVAMMILGGHSSKDLAPLLDISPATAKVHRSNLYRKLEISSQAALFRLFIDEDV